jgi:predicted GTPase
MIDAEVYENPTINIAIIGCISSGKSTILNSLFAETYSDMKIKKTTMCPQVYSTDKKILSPTKLLAKEIRKNNAEINKTLYDEKEKKFYQCDEVKYTVPPINDLFDSMIYNDYCEYKIYDIPGLNDSETKKIFYDYVKNNCYKFDIIIYNIDINTSLNTTDELDILQLIKQCIIDTKTKYDKDIKLIIICNKCDEMQFDDDNEIKGSDEIEEMYEQVKSIVSKNDIMCPIVKYSATYTYMYRSSEAPENIDKTYIDKIGIDNYGRVSWNKKTKNKSENEIWSLIKDCLSENIETSLKLSGYTYLKKVLTNILNEHFFDLMYSKINCHLTIDDFDTKHKYIVGLDEKFCKIDGHNVIHSTKIYKNHFDYYLEFIINKYKLVAITSSNIIFAKEYKCLLDKLYKLFVSYGYNARLTALGSFEPLYTAQSDYDKLKTKYNIQLITTSQFKSDEIVDLLKEIYINKDEFTLDKYKYLNNVAIDKFKDMCEYLYDEITFNELLLIPDSYNIDKVVESNLLNSNLYLEKLYIIKSIIKKSEEKIAVDIKLQKHYKLRTTYFIGDIKLCYGNGTYPTKYSDVMSIIKEIVEHNDDYKNIIEQHILSQWTNTFYMDSNITAFQYESLVRHVICGIENLRTMVSYLQTHNIDINVLKQLYINNIIKYYISKNTIFIRHILNYILKQYFNTNDEFYNEIHCYTNFHLITGAYQILSANIHNKSWGSFKEYSKYLIEFIEFYEETKEDDDDDDNDEDNDDDAMNMTITMPDDYYDNDDADELPEDNKKQIDIEKMRSAANKAKEMAKEMICSKSINKK